jgi:large repetitive protein
MNGQAGHGVPSEEHMMTTQRRFAERRLLGLWLTTALAVVGCECGPTDQCTVKSVRFITPADGATVSPMLDVQVEGLKSDGARVALGSASLTVRAEASAQPGPARQGTVSNNVATFMGLSLAAGGNTLEATVTEANKTTCQVKGSIAVTARGTMMPARVLAVTFPQDVNNDGILNAVEWPTGAQLRVNVSADNVSGLSVQVKQGSDVRGGPEAFVGGMASLSLDRLPDTTSGTIDVFAEIVNGAGAAQNTAAGNPEAVRTIRVRRASPMCTNTTRLLNGPMQDANPMQAGFQLRASGTVAPTVTEARFRITGVANSDQLMPMNGMVAADLTLPAMGDRQYTVVLEGQDAEGNVCSSPLEVRVDLDAPVVSVTSPAANDAGQRQVSASPATFTIASTSQTGQACFFRAQGMMMRQMVGCVRVMGGMASFMVPFPGAGAFEVTVEVTDEAGNVGVVRVPVNVALPGCGVAFTTPSACPSTVFPASLTSGVLPVTYESSNCIGQMTRLLVNGAAQATGTIAATGRFGPTNVDVNAADAGSLVLRAEVTNRMGMVDVADCTVAIDRTVPTITQPVVGPSGRAILAVRDDASVTAGAQSALRFSATVPMGGRIDVCTTQAVDPVTMGNRMACADGRMGWFSLRQGVTSDTVFDFPEGAYSLRLVVGSAGQYNSSDALPLTVDVTPPCVGTGSLRSDRDTGASVARYASDGRLNAAEYALTAPFLSFALGCGDTAATLDATTPVRLRQVVSGAVTDLMVGTAAVSVAAPRYNVSLSGLTGESDRVYFIELRDSVGNVSQLLPANDPSSLALRVDLVNPTCRIDSPAAMPNVLGSAQLPGGSLNVTVGTSPDVAAGDVALNLTGGSPVPTRMGGTIALGVYSASYVFTGDNNWNLAASCTDGSGNAATATPWSGRIDLMAPTCSFTAPAAGAMLTSNTVPVNIAVTGADGQTVTISSSVMSTDRQLTVAAGIAAGPLNFPRGMQTATARVRDTALNEGSCTRDFNVNTTNCNLSTNTLSANGRQWFNLGNTTSTGAGTGTASLVADSDCAAGLAVTLRRVLPTAGSPVAGTTNAMGDATFPVTVADGERYEVTIDNGMGVLTTVVVDVDLVAPAATGATIDGFVAPSSGTLTFVAATSNRNVRASTSGYYADQLPATPGAQFTLVMTGVTGSGGAGRAEVLLGSTSLATVPVTADGDVTLSSATLPQNATGTLAARLTDVAGNMSTVLSRPVVVDVVAPAASAVTVMGSPTKQGLLNLQWPASNDDAAPAAGQPAGYELRWTTSSVVGATRLQSESEYFANTTAVEPNDLAASATTTTLRLPPLNRYYLAIRAIDEVGNYGPFVAPPADDAVAPSNLWNEIILQGAANSFFGSSLLAQFDFTGDGQRDIVVGTGPTAGTIFVYAGGATLASQTGCVNSCTSLQAPDGGVAFFGADISGGDLNNDGRPDLVVSQTPPSSVSANPGRVFIYLGTAGPLAASPAVEIRGDSSATSFGLTARVIASIDGDAFPELVIASPTWDAAATSVGRTYIYRGRAMWPSMLTTADATWTITHNANSGYGIFRYGLVSLGDLNGDGQPDFTMPQSRGNVARLQLWSARTLWDPASPASGTVSLLSSQRLQELSGSVSASTAATAGFGAFVIGGRNFSDNASTAVLDLVVTAAQENQIIYYRDVPSTGVLGTPTVGACTVAGCIIRGGTNFGSALASGDFDGDSRLDIVASDGLTSMATPPPVWLLTQRTAGQFGDQIGTAPNTTVTAVRPLSPGVSSSNFGVRTDVAEVSGTVGADVDLVISDFTANRVYVRY